MDELLLWLACFLLANMLAGMVRVWRGPTPADRMLSAQLVGTTGVTALLVLAHPLDTSALYDVALVLALLAALSTVVFVRRVWSGANRPRPTAV